MKREKLRSCPCSLASLIIAASVVICGWASPSSAQSVTAYITETLFPMPVEVQVASINPTTAKITSVQAGCLDNTSVCAAGRKAKINCPLTPGVSDVCLAYFPAGSKVTLKASPGDFVFAGWDYETIAQGGNYNYGISKSITIRALGGKKIHGFFVPKGTTFNLALSPSTVIGSITAARIVSNPPGISCNGDGTGTCSYPFPAGTYVTLTAERGTGTELVGWNLRFPYFTDICDAPGPCRVPMSYILWN